MRVWVLIVCVYVCSLALTVLNKTMFDIWRLRIPLLATFINFTLVGQFLRLVYRRQGRPIPYVSSKDYRRFLVPVSLFTALDVGLSNLSYALLPVSVMTVVKSTNVVMTYGLSVVLGLEVFRREVLGACVLVVGGVIGAMGDHLNRSYSVQGLVYLTGAVLSLSIRWVLVHKMTKTVAALDLVYLTLPVSACFIGPVAAVVEVWPLLLTTGQGGGDVVEAGHGVTAGVLMLIGGSGLALGLLYCEYLLVQRTSSMTLCVAGIGKEILALVLSAVAFSEHLSLRQWAAVAVSLGGIFIFSRLHKSTNHGTNPGNTYRRGRSPHFCPVPTLSTLDLVPFE